MNERLNGSQRYSLSQYCHHLILHLTPCITYTNCERRPYTCPCPGTSCKWEGPLDNVLNILLTTHKTITTLGGEDIVFLATGIHLPGAVDWVMMQCCFDHYFMLVLEKPGETRGTPAVLHRRSVDRDGERGQRFQVCWFVCRGAKLQLNITFSFSFLSLLTPFLPLLFS